MLETVQCRNSSGLKSRYSRGWSRLGYRARLQFAGDWFYRRLSFRDDEVRFFRSVSHDPAARRFSLPRVGWSIGAYRYKPISNLTICVYMALHGI